MPIVRDPELKHVVLGTYRALEELVEPNLRGEPAVPKLCVRFADAKHARQVGNTCLADEQPVDRRNRGGSKHRTVKYIPQAPINAIPSIGVREKGIGYEAIGRRGS